MDINKKTSNDVIENKTDVKFSFFPNILEIYEVN